VKDVDVMLSLLENKARREILQRLVREPHYAYQLAEQIGVSQQAITKHLILLEKSEMVQSEKVPSSKGPAKRIYSVQKSFSIRIDLGPDLFKLEQRQLPKGGPMRLSNRLPKNTKKIAESLSGRKKIGIDEAIFLLSDLEESLNQLDEQRDALIALHQHVKNKASSTIENDFVHYEERQLVHSVFNNPREELDIAKLAFELQMPQNNARELADLFYEKLTRSMAKRSGNIIAAPENTTLPWWATLKKNYDKK
jgi:ArsR family transcriptional regulator